MGARGSLLSLALGVRLLRIGSSFVFQPWDLTVPSSFSSTKCCKQAAPTLGLPRWAPPHLPPLAPHSPLTSSCKVSQAGGWKSDSWCCSSAG